ncbi:hypothetical protein GCM10028815_06580 [Mariniluteicoccus flavus]
MSPDNCGAGNAPGQNNCSDLPADPIDISGPAPPPETDTSCNATFGATRPSERRPSWPSSSCQAPFPLRSVDDALFLNGTGDTSARNRPDGCATTRWVSVVNDATSTSRPDSRASFTAADSADTTPGAGAGETLGDGAGVGAATETCGTPTAPTNANPKTAADNFHIPARTLMGPPPARSQRTIAQQKNPPQPEPSATNQEISSMNIR